MVAPLFFLSSDLVPSPKRARYGSTENDALSCLTSRPPTKYIERKCAPVDAIVSKLTAETQETFVFTGPMSCGKTSTLAAVCSKMKSQDLKAAFIDMKAIDRTREEAIKVLVVQEQPKDIFFIDNAQELSNLSKITSLVKHAIYARGNGVCYAFSPVVCDPKGHSVFAAGIKERIDIYFTPFTRDELQDYNREHDIKLPNDLDLESTGCIPGVLAVVRKNAAGLSAAGPSAARIHEMALDEVRGMIHHQLARLRSALFDPMSNEDANEIQNTLLYAASYGCTTLSSSQTYPLRAAGFCYIENSTGECKLTYPKEVLMKKLEKHIASIQNTLAVFDKGAALEFAFFMASQRGFTAAKPDNTQEKTIPPVGEVWIQPCHGEVPNFVGPDYNKCLMIKLAIDHYAFDFMIVDCTGLGTMSRLIYFVQVSVQAYQNRKSNRKYSAIERASAHTSGRPPLNYYSSEFNVQLSNCFYVYASSAESSFGSDAENVYTVDL